jgi:hypothetical protein
MKAMSLRVGMGVSMSGAARWLKVGALCMAAWAPVDSHGQKVPIVWDVRWDIHHPGDSAAGMPDRIWQDALSSALTLRPPQRILGLPMQHAANRVLGRWQKAWERGDPAPPGSASAFDRVSMEQSERLFASRMLRMGCLDAEARLDTSMSGHRVTLHVKLQPGRRIRCGSVIVLGESSGLSGQELETLQMEWSEWTGQWLDLNAMDRSRAASASRLQEAGWFGFLSDHLVLDIDTTGSRKTGTANLTLRVLARNLGGQIAPHRQGRFEEVRVEWTPQDLLPMVDTVHAGIRWHVPKGRDVRTLAQRIHILPGDGFAPSRLAETRQRLRSCPLVDRVSLEVVDLPNSVGLRHHPLLLTAALTPLPKRLIRVNGALTSRQGLGGEVKLALSDLDFRQRMERISFDIQTGLETVADFTTEEEGSFIARILAASLHYDADRLIPFGVDRFPKSNRPESQISLSIRDENRPQFSRTFIQLALIERFFENRQTGSRIELRPFELTLTASRLEPGFETELQSLGSGILASTFASRALFVSGASWRFNPPSSPGKPSFRLNVEFESAGHLFHALDPRDPAATTVPIPTLFGSNSPVEVARYTRWVLDARLDRPIGVRGGLHARAYAGAAVSTIDGSAVPFEKQFYVGGPNSMRGWRALGLGPGRNAEETLGVRGDIRLELNLEGRHYVNDWIQVAAFVDAGNIWMTHPEEGRPDVEFTANRVLDDFGVAAGGGIRLDFGYFLLRCDAGRPIRNPGGGLTTSHGWRIHPAVSLPF